MAYLLKDAEQSELLRAIYTVASGGVIFSPGIAGRVLRYLSESTAATPASNVFDELTARERGILDLLARGCTNPEIAEQLGLTAKTVSNNVSNVLLKVVLSPGNRSGKTHAACPRSWSRPTTKHCRHRARLSHQILD